MLGAREPSGLGTPWTSAWPRLTAGQRPPRAWARLAFRSPPPEVPTRGLGIQDSPLVDRPSLAIKLPNRATVKGGQGLITRAALTAYEDGIPTEWATTRRVRQRQVAATRLAREDVPLAHLRGRRVVLADQPTVEGGRAKAMSTPRPPQEDGTAIILAATPWPSPREMPTLEPLGQDGALAHQIPSLLVLADRAAVKGGRTRTMSTSLTA